MLRSHRFAPACGGMIGSTGMEHDRLFKALLTTFFVDFLELFFSGGEAKSESTEH
jgi:hypothetical protein